MFPHLRPSNLVLSKISRGLFLGKEDILLLVLTSKWVRLGLDILCSFRLVFLSLTLLGLLK